MPLICEQEKSFEAIKKSGLFDGLNKNDIHAVLPCLNANIIQRKKGDYVFQPDSLISHIGIVLEGCVHLIQEDYWGNRVIVDRLSEGGIIGEAHACKQQKMFPLRIIAAKDCTVLLINSNRILTTCKTACSYHTEILKNMIMTMAGRNIALFQKIEHTSQRTLEEKVMSFLSTQASLNQSSSFDILFSRQELADYLSIDRSSLSRTLSALKEKGLINYRGSVFELFDENFIARASL